MTVEQEPHEGAPTNSTTPSSRSAPSKSLYEHECRKFEAAGASLPTQTPTGISSSSAVRNLGDHLPSCTPGAGITQETLTLAYLELLRRAPQHHASGAGGSRPNTPPIAAGERSARGIVGGTDEGEVPSSRLSFHHHNGCNHQYHSSSVYNPDSNHMSSSSSRRCVAGDSGRDGVLAGFSYLALLGGGGGGFDAAEDRLRGLAQQYSRSTSRRHDRLGDLTDTSILPTPRCCREEEHYHHHGGAVTRSRGRKRGGIRYDDEEEDVISVIVGLRSFRWILMPLLILLCCFLAKQGFRSTHIQAHGMMMIEPSLKEGSSRKARAIDLMERQVGGIGKDTEGLSSSTAAASVGGMTGSNSNSVKAKEEVQQEGEAAAAIMVKEEECGEEFLKDNKELNSVNSSSIEKEGEKVAEKKELAAAMENVGDHESNIGEEGDDEEEEVEEEVSSSPISSLLAYSPPVASSSSSTTTTRSGPSIVKINHGGIPRTNNTPMNGALAPLPTPASNTSPRLNAAAVLAGWGSGPLELQRVYERAFIEEDISLMETVSVCGLEMMHQFFTRHQHQLAQLKEGWCVPREGGGRGKRKDQCEPNLVVRLALQIWDVTRMGMHKVQKLAINVGQAVGEKLASLPAPSAVIQEYNAVTSSPSSSSSS